MSDYTKQLDEIVRLLSRPGISPWLLSTFSVLLGMVAGAIVRGVEPWIADISRRKRLRRVLYRNIASMFLQVDAIKTFGANNSVRDDAFGRLGLDLDFDAEGYINTNRDVFTQLEESPAARHIYNLFHRIISDGAPTMESNCNRVQWMLGRYIRNESLPERYFQEFLHKNQAERLITRATEIYDKSLEQEQERQKQNERYLGT